MDEGDTLTAAPSGLFGSTGWEVVVAAVGDIPPVVAITRKKKTTLYWVSVFPADFGVGVLFEKFERDAEEPRYHVNLDLERGVTTCECRGHLRWGTPCKHIEAALGLLADEVLRLPCRTCLDMGGPRTLHGHDDVCPECGR